MSRCLRNPWEIQGILFVWVFECGCWLAIQQTIQWFATQFPTHRNREFIRLIREFRFRCSKHKYFLGDSRQPRAVRPICNADQPITALNRRVRGSELLVPHQRLRRGRLDEGELGQHRIDLFESSGPSSRMPISQTAPAASAAQKARKNIAGTIASSDASGRSQRVLSAVADRLVRSVSREVNAVQPGHKHQCGDHGSSAAWRRAGAPR